MSRARTAHACDQSAADDYAPDGEGWQRHRAADLAKQHLAAMAPDRRAQLEQEWKS